MDDRLLPWLRGQIARDEQSAHAMTHGIAGIESRWSPSRLLAQCEAHTAVLDAYDLVQQDLAHNLAKQRDRHYTDALPRLVKECHLLDGREQGLRYAIGCITTAYQHNPGYREEWRP